MAKFDFHTTGAEVAAEFKNNIAGKTILITGASPKGLGAETAKTLALYKPALIILAGRDVSKIEETQKSIKSQFPDVPTRALVLDLTSLEAVRKAADEVNSYQENIDILYNNAGVMAVRELKRTREGFEMHFGTNHVGHFLFTNLIMGKILAAGRGARIVNVSSSAYRYSPVNYEDPNYQVREYEKWGAYAQAKSANVLFSKALAKKLGPKGVYSFSLCPGAVGTNLAREMSSEEQEAFAQSGNIKMKTIGEGIATHIAAAFDPSLEDVNGAFVNHSNATPLNDSATWLYDKQEPQKLWELSERLVGQQFPY